MNTLENTPPSGTKTTRPATFGEKFAIGMIIAIVAYLFITS